MPWDPVKYLTYSHYRLRPALDLIYRIPDFAPKMIVDLGCGVGNITRQLYARWPEAKVIGVDSSGEKLEKAAQIEPNIEWKLADIEDYIPPEPVDLLFSNSTLQWLNSHEILFPKLLSYVSNVGFMAVQMSRNFTSPAITALYKTAREGPWQAKLEDLIRPEPCKSPEFYWELLHSHTNNLEIWETIYLQAMEGDRPVVDFLQSSILHKFYAHLDIQEQLAFEESYCKKIRIAYPERSDGKTLFPYRRLFIVAQNKES